MRYMLPLQVFLAVVEQGASRFDFFRAQDEVAGQPVQQVIIAIQVLALAGILSYGCFRGVVQEGLQAALNIILVSRYGQ